MSVKQTHKPEPKPMSLRDSILAAQQRKLEPVEVPEWGCTVYVPLLTLGEHDAWQKASAGGLAKMAAFIIRDDQNNRVCTDDDAEALNGKSLNVIDRIVAAFYKLNGKGDAGKN